MDNDLVPLAGYAGVHATMERGFGDQRERVGRQLAPRRRLTAASRSRGNVRRDRLASSPLLIDGVARGARDKADAPC
jgi:hypothetical protein